MAPTICDSCCKDDIRGIVGVLDHTAFRANPWRWECPAGYCWVDAGNPSMSELVDMICQLCPVATEIIQGWSHTKKGDLIECGGLTFF